MSDLISREEAIANAISGRTREVDGEKWIRVSEVRESIKTLPSAEPKKGKWVEYTKVIIPDPYNHWEQAWKCSECGYDDGFVAWNYCPNCGARMDKDE